MNWTRPRKIRKKESWRSCHPTHGPQPDTRQFTLTDKDKQAIRKEIYEKFVSPEKRTIAQDGPEKLDVTPPETDEIPVIDISSSLFEHISQADHLHAEEFTQNDDGLYLHESAGLENRMNAVESRVDTLQSCLESVVTLIKQTLPTSTNL